MRIKRREKRVISTTHLDLHNERISKEALEQMAEQISKNPVPVNVEHNPLLPPIGRVVSASVEPTKDGEYALVGLVEIFDESSYATILNAESVIPSDETINALMTVDKELDFSQQLEADIRYDPRNYSEERVKAFCFENSRTLTLKDKLVARKAVEPPSVIWLTLLTPLVYFFAKGFFTKIGERLGEKVANELINAYESFKTSLVCLLNSRTKSDVPVLLLEFEHPITAAKVEGAVKSKSKVVVQNALDRTHELFVIVEYLIKNNPALKFERIQFVFNPKTKRWALNYLILDSGEILFGNYWSSSRRKKK